MVVRRTCNARTGVQSSHPAPCLCESGGTVDALVLGTSVLEACGFKSLLSHQAARHLLSEYLTLSFCCLCSYGCNGFDGIDDLDLGAVPSISTNGDEIGSTGVVMVISSAR